MGFRTLSALCLPLLFATFSAEAAGPKYKPEATARLLAAAAGGDEDDILTALADGADPNARDAEKNTPLILAAGQSLFGKERQVVEALLGAKAQINAANARGVTAVMMAAATDRVGYLRVLLQNDAKVDLADEDGWTALMFAAGGGNSSSSKELIEGGANVNAAEKKGWTPLTMALLHGRGAVVEQLLAAKATMPAKPPGGIAAIKLAAHGRDLGVVRQVLEAGEQLGVRDEDISAALSIAAENGDGQIVMELLRAGADPALKNKNGRTALDLAKTNEHPEIVAILGGEWTKPALTGGTTIAIPCEALGGKVDAHFAIDGTALVVTTLFPRPLTWYFGGGNTNRAESAKKLTYEGSFAPAYYFDVDSNTKTGAKATFIKEATGADYAIDYMQYGTSVTLKYRDSDGELLTKPVYANVLSVHVEKDGEQLSTADLGDDDPRALNDRGALVTRVPLSLLKLAKGKPIRLTAKIGACDAVVSKLTLR